MSKVGFGKGNRAPGASVLALLTGCGGKDQEGDRGLPAVGVRIKRATRRVKILNGLPLYSLPSPG